jgi:hypothetical protein
MREIDDVRPRLDSIVHDKAFDTKRAEDAQSTYHHRVSNAGSCPRALVYQALGTPATAHSGRMAIIFDDGNVHEDATVRWLSETGFVVSDRQLGVDVFEISDSSIDSWHCDSCNREIDGGIIHGHIDGLIHSDRTFLFEHKSMNDRAFNRLNEELPLGYISQCCSYIYGLSRDGINIDEALLLCKNKDNAEYRQLYLTYDVENDMCRVVREWNGFTEFVDKPVKKVIELHQLVDACLDFEGNLPKRPYTLDDWHCGFCRYKEICWDGYSQEIGALDVDQVIPHSDILATKITRLSQLKAEKRRIESEMKSIRPEIIKGLEDRGIKSGVAGDVSFGIRVSKRSYVDKKLLPEDLKVAATRSFVIQSLSIGGEEAD